MPSTATTSASARTVDEQFLDLLYDDADLLAAEFDAIIAAEWPEPPADKPARSTAGMPPDGGSLHGSAGATRGPVAQPTHPGIGGCARQRSPPFRHTTHHWQEGR